MNENLEKVNENTPKDEEQNVVRNRSEKIVVEYRKPSIFMSLLLILIGVCLATIVLLLVYIFKIKPQNEAKPTTPTEQTEVVEEPEKEETKVPDVDLSIEGEFVKGLENKIPYDMYELKNYIDNKVDQSTVTNTEKLFYVFMLLKDENKGTEVSAEGIANRLDKPYDSNGYITKADKYSVELVQERYSQIFGTDQVAPKEDVDVYYYHVDYDTQDGCYYGHYFAGGGGMPWIADRRIESASRSDDGTEIYLYEYYIRAGIMEDKSIYTYGKDVGSPLGEEAAATYYENIKNTNINNWHVKDEIFEKYKDQLVKFKSTFKLDTNGNYYWVSTEPVK